MRFVGLFFAACAALLANPASAATIFEGGDVRTASGIGS